MNFYDPTNDGSHKTVKMQKKVRKIVQDVKVSYEPKELMFDFMKQQQLPHDIYEQNYQNMITQSIIARNNDLRQVNHI